MSHLVIHLWIYNKIKYYKLVDVVKSLGRKEGNVLFNNTLNTFYLWLYGVRHGKIPLR